VDPVGDCAELLLQGGADGGCGGADEGFVFEVVAGAVQEGFEVVEGFLADAAGFVRCVEGGESRFVSCEALKIRI
jgi:hypothetical protein